MRLVYSLTLVIYIKSQSSLYLDAYNWEYCISIFYLYLTTLHNHLMANTRNRGANKNNNNNANPPSPPTLEQVLIMQAQMLQTMQQTMANMQQAQGH
jgi:hypothetical protein